MLIVPVVLACIAVGCGGGSSDPARSSASATSSDVAATSALTKAKFIKLGDAICAATDKKQNAAFKAYSAKHPGEKPGKASQEKVIVSVGLPPIHVEAEELAGLSAPGGDQAKISAIVQGIEAATAKAEKDPSSVLLRGVGNPFFEVDGLAREYGFKACASAL